MKKSVLTSIAVIMSCLLILVGCTPKGSQSSNGGSGGKGEKTVVTAFSSKTPIISSFNDNLLTQKIEKKLNIDIQFQTTPADGAAQKQSLILASGDYPDAFIGGDFSGIDQLKYGKQGVFIPLNNLIDKYAPHIKKAFEDNPSFKKAVTMPDGNIYGLPGRMGCYHCTYPLKMWINKDWLKKLNLPMPKTTQDFEKVLMAFKNNDPNGNGKKDEIPLSGITQDQEMDPVNFIMNAFIYDDPFSYLQVVNGKVSFVANTTQWKQGLAYLRDLYKKGLIDPQTFTQQLEGIQQLANKGDKATLGTFPALWSGAALTISDKNAPRWTQYVAVPPLTGPNGYQETMYTGNSVDGAKFTITNKADKAQQIAAIKIADYIYSREGSLDEMFGVKGKGWVPAKKGEIGVNGKQAIFRPISSGDPNKPTNTLWDNDFTFLTEDMYNGQVASQDTNKVSGYERFLYLQTKNKYDGIHPDEMLLSDVVDPSKAQEVAQIKTDISNYVQQSEVEFIMGKKNLDSDWDAYVKQLDSLGVKDYVQIYQDSYNGQNK